MSEPEKVDEPAPVPAPKKRKYTRRKRLPPAAAPKPAAELAGLSVKDCPKACGVTGCVISGNGICAHPMKGGLQGKTMADPAALARFRGAQKMLGKKVLDARFA